MISGAPHFGLAPASTRSDFGQSAAWSVPQYGQAHWLDHPYDAGRRERCTVRSWRAVLDHFAENRDTETSNKEKRVTSAQATNVS